MVKEEYVSFDVAKLLREKGFDEKCAFIYRTDGSLLDMGWGYQRNSSFVGYYSAPTQALVMRWLREVYHINIELKINKNTFLWRYRISLRNGSTSCFCSNVFISYEKACEDAIKYCLENLI
jgi:hypothetical protein